jgi:tetrahydromethanopterin S-methyltransferase subunit A
MRLRKCRKCGCMLGTLENLRSSLPSLKKKEAKDLLKDVEKWLGKLEPLEYPCFGCRYCIPPEAMTMLTREYPELASSTLSSCEIKVSKDSWPPVEGEYTVMDRSAPVAVSTLASLKLEEKLAKTRPSGLCIAGKTETENIGIDKIVKNVISNPAISYLIVAGKDPEGHKSGETLLALLENGVDKDMRVIGSTGRRPILKNISRKDVDTFRRQVQAEDMRGSENIRALTKRIGELSLKAGHAKSGLNYVSCGCQDETCAPTVQPVKINIRTGSLTTRSADDNNGKAPGAKPRHKASSVPKIKVKKYGKEVKLDKAGYFVIIPSKKTGNILVEHYSYENKLLRKIEGRSSRDIYFTIINNNWVTELSHAAYLGKELVRAEISIKKRLKFIQDGA